MTSTTEAPTTGRTRPPPRPRPRPRRARGATQSRSTPQTARRSSSRRCGSGTAPASTFAVHATKDAKGKKKNERGATEQHASLEQAKAAVEKLAGEAAKRGWVQKARASGFVPKPDAFTAATLPTAKKK